jgi:hypothetical protein
VRWATEADTVTLWLSSFIIALTVVSELKVSLRVVLFSTCVLLCTIDAELQFNLPRGAWS